MDNSSGGVREGGEPFEVVLLSWVSCKCNWFLSLRGFTDNKLRNLHLRPILWREKGEIFMHWLVSSFGVLNSLNIWARKVWHGCWAGSWASQERSGDPGLLEWETGEARKISGGAIGLWYRTVSYKLRRCEEETICWIDAVIKRKERLSWGGDRQDYM
jgi:hypothetical protein